MVYFNKIVFFISIQYLGLLTTVTVSLTLTATRMRKRSVLVKNLETVSQPKINEKHENYGIYLMNMHPLL